MKIYLSSNSPCIAGRVAANAAKMGLSIEITPTLTGKDEISLSAEGAGVEFVIGGKLLGGDYLPEWQRLILSAVVS